VISVRMEVSTDTRASFPAPPIYCSCPFGCSRAQHVTCILPARRLGRAYGCEARLAQRIVCAAPSQGEQGGLGCCRAIRGNIPLLFKTA